MCKQMHLLGVLLLISLRLAGQEVAKNQTDTTAFTPSVFIKTNALFLSIGAPNVGVEVSINQKFSVAADVVYAYWQLKNLYALQTFQGGIEAKYWFDVSKGLLTGWNVGIYGMCGDRYDVQWKDGYQGNGFWSAGLGAGYSLPVSKKMRVEFALAAGYFYTPEVRHYHRPQEGHLLWEETRYNVGRFSLTKMKVNLVWTFAKKKTAGR